MIRVGMFLTISVVTPCGASSKLTSSALVSISVTSSALVSIGVACSARASGLKLAGEAAMRPLPEYEASWLGGGGTETNECIAKDACCGGGGGSWCNGARFGNRPLKLPNCWACTGDGAMLGPAAGDGAAEGL